jgi:hypothetical protein
MMSKRRQFAIKTGETVVASFCEYSDSDLAKMLVEIQGMLMVATGDLVTKSDALRMCVRALHDKLSKENKNVSPKTI